MVKVQYYYLIVLLISVANAEEGLGCGGFIISHTEIDFTKIEVELYTKNGILKDKASCAPSSGYYFIPIYDHGEYVLQLAPPAGWSLTPGKVQLSIDGVSDLCSKGEDINFVFKGFGITGIVESYGTTGIGPEGVSVEMKSDKELRKTTTKKNGIFFFTPVFPGQYSLSISHKLWGIHKKSIIVNVSDGNTELKLGSLVISGYDVTGYVKNDGQPTDGIEIVLFQSHEDKQVPLVDGCKKVIIKELEQKGKQLCHISVSSKGDFTFNVSPGRYFIIPYSKRRHIHFEPELIEFQVEHSSLLLSKTLKVVGFSVFGVVRTSKDGKPIKDAIIFLNGNKVTTTTEDGTYTLENIKSDTYSISVTAENVQFEAISLKLNQNVLQIPDFIPSLYKVCGVVLSEQTHKILITTTGSTQLVVATSSLPGGKFCTSLPRGKHSMKVVLSENETSQGIQFFPTSYDFEITDSSVKDITFSQLKAKIVGKVICNNPKDCKEISVIFKFLSNESDASRISIVTLQENGSYVFENVRQGNYEVSLASNKFCWKKSLQTISVTSVNEVVPPFVQTGYLVVFTSSHNSKVSYVVNQQEKFLDIVKGKTSLCLEKPGVYDFKLQSCHVYERDVISHNTNSKEYEVNLNALKHTTIVEIECDEKFGELYMSVTIDQVDTLVGPLQYKNKRYYIPLLLKNNESVILVPNSEQLFVNPATLTITGQDDCSNVGVKFNAKKGKIFTGRINPPLQGVSVTLETNGGQTLIDETNIDGIYKFPPQDGSNSYKVVAKKDYYILYGPDEQGNFKAFKLAQIDVTVVFTDNEPLQGVLLSLSGGQGYRKNIATGDDGVVSFHSLSPGEYFLKPMKKEYNFEPSTKIISAQEGITVPITFKGKRFAFSAYGIVTSLSGEAEEKVTILASGLGNCSHLLEEATSETNGQFRIRGLHPYCSYNVKVKYSKDERHIECGSPTSLNVSVTERDLHDLKFTVFKSTLNADVLVHVHCKNPDEYKSLRISLSRESNPAGLIHTAKLENHKITKHNAGIIMYLPQLPLDEKSYYLQVESTGPFADTTSDIYYFTANSSLKYIDVNCHSQKGIPRMNIKQTSLWTLFLMFISFLVFYNIEYITQIVKEQLNKLNVGQVINKIRPPPPPTEFVIDKNEIDQIVESINPTKRKLKPRKT